MYVESDYPKQTSCADLIRIKRTVEEVYRSLNLLVGFGHRGLAVDELSVVAPLQRGAEHRKRQATPIQHVILLRRILEIYGKT